jgi:hypothetical protein
MSSELIEGDELTEEQKAADAALIAADMGPVYAPMLEAKRAKAAKTGNRKKRDRRFKLSHDEAAAAPPTRNNDDDPWNSKVPLSDEVRRITQVVQPYLAPNCAVDTFRSDINKQELFDRVFDGREQSTKKLLRLYAFMMTRHPAPFDIRCLASSPLFYLVEEILLNEKAITAPLSQPMSVTFGDEFEEIRSEQSQYKQDSGERSAGDTE